MCIGRVRCAHYVLREINNDRARIITLIRDIRAIRRRPFNRAIFSSRHYSTAVKIALIAYLEYYYVVIENFSAQQTVPAAMR